MSLKNLKIKENDAKSRDKKKYSKMLILPLFNGLIMRVKFSILKEEKERKEHIFYFVVPQNRIAYNYS